MKMIDGDDLADRLLSDAITDDQRRQANMIANVIEEMPEAIVRCKDCRYFESYYHGDGMFSHQCLWRLVPDVDREGYCNHGRKKND